ncbi:isoamylase early set domain-containing protein [Marinomonas algarum]|uniref:Isoamylase early set domain-containing protein n=1 Tax=Marinomonas algarum TaxID=2883105 RepID=A0A9X1LCW9_9GAMM|nr:isoamylase early set domain-containing protein [Marinomonas algarum]MCB5162539.1 isoamylase early set domain-containing protein [Marinomonas algarum]
MIEKTYLKTKPQCKVKFMLPASEYKNAKSIAVVGDFNQWDKQANLMKKQRSGFFASTLNLDVQTSYQFRYLIDGEEWCNDEMADDHTPSPIGPDANSVLHL